ncbi:thioesterase family protein [Streptomyces sp. NPDC086549]|uniref:thioesterase family protein n=1 Tax=Streptomyces sp. NPDC086549 TaxID=3365752 RepID=UPI0037F13E00
MRHEVTEADTAVTMGSGDVPVLSTPRLIAWMEAATMRAAAPFTEAGRTTVGTALRVEHVRATRVGGWVDVFAEPPVLAGRRLTFRVRAVDGSGRLVAAGEIDRAIVDRARFLEATTDEGKPGRTS